MKIKRRIIGLDFARAWAMFGMLIVNFMVITGAEGNGPPWLPLCHYLRVALLLYLSYLQV